MWPTTLGCRFVYREAWYFFSAALRYDWGLNPLMTPPKRKALVSGASYGLSLTKITHFKVNEDHFRNKNPPDTLINNV